MQPNASPAANDDADAEPPAGQTSRKAKKAARYQYGTGDRPLDGYTIKRGVGRGGFGEVYFATSDAGKEVALKLIRRNLDVELRGVRQCLNLKHANLVSLYDLRSDDADDEWVVMEYVSGESLEDAIERHPKGMPVEEALEWFRGIAAGVAYLHASGIVHRDLKPGNIYLERGSGPISQRVKIGDYGLSKFISTSRRSGQTESVGTVHYMAPEIAGGRYGREIDAYALGIILYEMLTGHVPFEGESVGEVLMKHLTAEPNLSRVAEPYRSIIAGALAKDPEYRMSSVEEMLAPLQTDKAPEPLAADPITPVNAEVWSPVSRPPHTDHPTPPREPLWEGMVQLSDRTRHNWRSWGAPPLAKGLLLFAGVTVAIVTSPGWITLVGTLGVFYLLYYIVWAAFFQGATESPKEPELKQTVAYKHKPSRAKKRRLNWRGAALRERAQRSTREKAVTLTGSMVVSAIAAIVVAVIAAPLLSGGAGNEAMALGVWMASVIGIGAWGVLASSALSTSRFEDRLPRRAMNAIVGACLGSVAFWLGDSLGLSLPYMDDAIAPRPNDVFLEEAFDLDFYRGVETTQLNAGLRSITPPILGSVVYFGLAFFLIRWWKSADYVRRSRIGFWSIAATTVGAWLVTIITWYPQPLGLVIIGGVAFATQVASPWCPPSQRVAFARAGQAGGIYDA